MPLKGSGIELNTKTRMGCGLLYYKLRFYFLMRILLLLGLTPMAAAMPVKSKTVKSRVQVVDAENRPLQSLDLKLKTLAVGTKDLETCGASMVRAGQTLSYSCTIPIPVAAKVSRFQNLISKKSFEAPYAGRIRQVHIDVSDDGRSLILATSFDSTGIDFDLSKFNDDFFALYAQAAHSIFTEALKKQTIQMEVLESRQ